MIDVLATEIGAAGAVLFAVGWVAALATKHPQLERAFLFLVGVYLGILGHAVVG